MSHRRPSTYNIGNFNEGWDGLVKNQACQFSYLLVHSQTGHKMYPKCKEVQVCISYNRHKTMPRWIAIVTHTHTHTLLHTKLKKKIQVNHIQTLPQNHAQNPDIWPMKWQSWLDVVVTFKLWMRLCALLTAKGSLYTLHWPCTNNKTTWFLLKLFCTIKTLYTINTRASKTPTRKSHEKFYIHLQMSGQAWIYQARPKWCYVSLPLPARRL